MPFKRDLSDLERQLKWAMANDEKVVKKNCNYNFLKQSTCV